MSSILLSSKVLETLSRFSMVREGERVLVALSGGADSVALTHLLDELRPKLRLSLFLAHLNHGLRAEASEEESFCRELAASLSIPILCERLSVGESARRHGRSIEDEARRARYRFLESARIHFRCQRIAVGHTLDDQAETFLLRLMRGSGAKGLSSVHPVLEGTVVRPLLELRRSEILEYLDTRGIPHREDASNADTRFTRNRLRHRDLPRLREAYNPRLVETLARSASILREEEEWMDVETRRSFREIAAEREGAVRIDVPRLAACHPALARRVVRLAIERARGDLENVTERHVRAVLGLLENGKSGRELHLPGVVAERTFQELRIRTRPAGRARNGSERGYNGYEYRLSIPTRVAIPEGGGVLSVAIARKGSPSEGPVASRAFGKAVLLGIEPDVEGDIERSLPELTVRSGRPGDRFRPLGAPGSKTLTRYLMERKVCREERRSVPVVVRAAGAPREEILWVVGHGVSESSRITAGRRCLSLEWETR